MPPVTQQVHVTYMHYRKLCLQVCATNYTVISTKTSHENYAPNHTVWYIILHGIHNRTTKYGRDRKLRCISHCNALMGTLWTTYYHLLSQHIMSTTPTLAHGGMPCTFPAYKHITVDVVLDNNNELDGYETYKSSTCVFTDHAICIGWIACI